MARLRGSGDQAGAAAARSDCGSLLQTTILWAHLAELGGGEGVCEKGGVYLESERRAAKVVSLMLLVDYLSLSFSFKKFLFFNVFLWQILETPGVSLLEFLSALVGGFVA